MITYSKSNFSIYIIKRIFIFILSSLLFNNKNNLFSFSILLKPKYNFGNHQNPEIDKIYKHLKGRNLYFITETPEKTMYAIIIYPENNLKIGLKMYTNSSLLIDSLSKGKKIFMGIDLLINNTDIYLMEYNTDIVICYFDLYDANCNDYIFDIDDKTYRINKNGKFSNNNLIPINFETVELNLLKENVLEYKNYYCVDFIKNYTENFDNVTMLNYFLYTAMVMNRSVIGFYGIADSIEELKSLSINKILFYQQVHFVDGIGLENYSYFICKSYSFKLIFIMIFFFFL